MTTTTRRDERRKDRLTQAQIDREDEAARSKLRAAERKAAQDRNLAASRASAARRAEAGRWCAEHAADLMLAPVIAASLVLSWTGMAAYGTKDYGLAGVALPVISEFGAWAFAFSAAVCARRGDHRLWACRVGVLVFAGVGAALNFLHGDAHGGVTVGVTMAIVSVAGITAHQLIKAGPQRSHIDRRIARRIRKAQRDAVDAAPVEVGADGGARLLLDAPAQPETEPVAVPETAPPVAPRLDGPQPVTVAVHKERYGTLRLTFTPAVNRQADGRIGGSASAPVGPVPWPPVTPPADPVSDPLSDPGNDPHPNPSGGTEKKRPRRRRAKPDKVTELIKAGKTTPEIMRATGASESTVKRRRSALREEPGAAPAVVNLADRRRA